MVHEICWNVHPPTHDWCTRLQALIMREVEGICNENNSLNPLSLYGRTKTEGRMMLDASNLVSLRFATAFVLLPGCV